MSKGVFYRSDTRPPRKDLVESWRHDKDWELFKQGFDSRDPKMKIKQRFGDNNKKKTFDIDPNSAVCVTRHFEAAPLFPVSNKNCDSFVYIVELEASKLYNTQEKQWDYAINHLYDNINPLYGFKGMKESTVMNERLWPMFGQERATKKIEPGEIAGCILVERFNSINPNDFTDRFKCLEWIPNEDFTGSEAVTTIIDKLVVPLCKKQDEIKCPKQHQGVAKSTGK